MSADRFPVFDETKASDVEAFVTYVRSVAPELYRDLPWRRTRDPYAVWLSEVMLQQTQVARVEPYWTGFLDDFPTVDALAAASTADVLERWQGLGYNRRAVALKRCAEICSRDFGGHLPRDYDALVALPGIGPATAAGIRAFAFDCKGVYLETNVRTVFLHSFFRGVGDPVADSRLIPLIERTCPDEDVRGWYYALLDLGAQMKAEVPNPSRASKHHSVQSTFTGSHRQKRAELLRIVLAEPGIARDKAAEALDAAEEAAGRTQVEPAEFERIVVELCAEGLISAVDGRLVV